MIGEILAIVLTIFLVVLLVIILAVVAFLFIPFGIRVNASLSPGGNSVDVALSWLGLTLWRIKRPEVETKKKKKEIEKKKPAEKVQIGLGRAAHMFPLLRESMPSLVILGKSGMRGLRLKRLSADFEIGLGDPAETALLAGYIWSFSWLLNRIPRVSFTFRPDMQDFGAEGSVRGDAMLRLFPIAIGFLRAYSRKPFRRLIKEARKSGRRKEK